MPIKREIIYPIFLECCQYTIDKFWLSIFEDLAYSMAPYGTYISKDFLCCRYKKKEFTYKIEKKDPKVCHDEVYLLLTKKLGLESHSEKLRSKKIFNELDSSLTSSIKTWNDIKKKNMKKILIELYVTRIRSEYSLTITQARYLLSIILLGIAFKVISSSDIKYSNGQIDEIIGISFLKNQIIFEKELYNMDTNSSPHIIIDKKLFSDHWEKYLKDLGKKKF